MLSIFPLRWGYKCVSSNWFGLRNSNFRKRSITENKFISSQNNNKIAAFFSFIFINLNWLYSKPIKVRWRLRLVRGSATAALASSLEGTLPIISRITCSCVISEVNYCIAIFEEVTMQTQGLGVEQMEGSHASSRNWHTRTSEFGSN
jgi:hypothetical protein